MDLVLQFLSQFQNIPQRIPILTHPVFQYPGINLRMLSLYNPKAWKQTLWAPHYLKLQLWQKYAGPYVLLKFFFIPQRSDIFFKISIRLLINQTRERIPFSEIMKGWKAYFPFIPIIRSSQISFFTSAEAIRIIL